MAEAKKKIIYIMGSGRSGTTLLDMLLGNDENIFSAGEINRIPLRSGITPGRTKKDPVFSFWQNVIKDLKIADFGGLVNLIKKFEYHSSFLRPSPQIHEKERYSEFVNQLIVSIFDKVEEDLVIDSSKYPLRAYHLSSICDNLKYCIYLKKHPVSILRSFQKVGIEQPRKSWFSVNVYLIMVHFLCIWTKRSLEKKGIKVLTIYFEDILDDPIQILRQIEVHLGIGLNSLIQKIKKKDVLSSNYLFDGNRIRLNKTFKLQKNKDIGNWTFVDHFVYVCNRFWWKRSKK